MDGFGLLWRDDIKEPAPRRAPPTRTMLLNCAKFHGDLSMKAETSQVLWTNETTSAVWLLETACSAS